MSEPTPTLQSLLINVEREDYDDCAVRTLIERDPGVVRNCDFRVLLHALDLGASAATIRSICGAYPEAIREKNSNGEGALHRACRGGASLDVVSLLYERWPEGVAAKDRYSHTPIHEACCRGGGARLEVVKFLVSKYPEALCEKDDWGRTPLAMACMYRSQFDDLLAFLIETRPAAVKEMDPNAWLPLHFACYHRASLKVVAMLVDIFPGALESKTNHDRETPLHLACQSGASIDVVKLLIERCPRALQLQNNYDRIPLQIANEAAPDSPAPPEVIEVLSTFHSLNNLAANDSKVKNALNRFHNMNWPGGVAIVLDAFPSVVNTIDHRLFPSILSFVGRHCALDTLYSMILDNPALVKGAVKEGKQAEQPLSKKAPK